MQHFPLEEHTQPVLSGSLSDGVGYPPADEDNMFIFLTPDLVVRSSFEEALRYNAPLMIPCDSSPGYCLLWIPNKYNHSFGHACVNEYLSSLEWKRSFFIPGFDLHGPCLSGSIGHEEYDYANALKLNFWPDQANGWIHRERHYGWPSYSVLQTIVSNGCHVVPIGDGDSSAANHQWRISFSLAERTLSHTFNHTQLLIYSVLKFVMKRLINLHEPDCMCSYFVKTTLFYCIENTETTMWETGQLDLCYSKCLTLLYHFVDGMFCPNFFMRGYNLFRRKINAQNRPRILSILLWLLQLGISGALYHTKDWFLFFIPKTEAGLEAKVDALILRGIWFQKLICQIRGTISSTPNISHSFEKTVQLIVETALQCLTTEEARDVTLLLSRIISSYTASKLAGLSKHQVNGNKCNYNITKLIQTFYKRGSMFDVSLGRLRYATYLYMMNDADQCLSVIQQMLSAMQPCVHIEISNAPDVFDFEWYQQEICGRGLSLADKSTKMLACAIMFLPGEYYNIPAAIRILMCGGMAIGCADSVAFDPIMYAYFLQGICFIRQCNQRAVDNSMRMLLDRLQNNSFIEVAVPLYRAYGYSLLGWLELERTNVEEAMPHFIKSYISMQHMRNILPLTNRANIFFGHLNMGIACNKLINKYV